MKTNYYKITYVDVTWPEHHKVFYANNYDRAKQFYDERSKELTKHGYDVEEKNIKLEVQRLQEA